MKKIEKASMGNRLGHTDTEYYLIDKLNEIIDTMNELMLGDPRYMPVKATKPWSPEDLKCGDMYWFIGTGINYYTALWFDSLTDKWRHGHSNCFQTKEAAEAYKAKKLADYNNK